MNLDHLIEHVSHFESLDDFKPWRELIAKSYEWLNAALLEEPIESLINGRAKLIDALLQRAWTISGLAERTKISLCAVGGYGRGHLQPYSDIDLLIVSKKRLNKREQEVISHFITFLWDIKLDIGQSVRTIKECVVQAKDDVTIATNLVELRFLAGSKETFDTLWHQVNEKHRWSSKSFFLAKVNEQKERRTKFHDTTYNLEPNVKENPGCLRDIQTVAWVAKQHFREFDGKSLIGHGYMTEAEHTELVDCRTTLWRYRCALHLIAKRSENRLLFDYQPEVAEKLGYTGSSKAPVESMMRDFYRAASRVFELNKMLLQRFEVDILGIRVRKLTTLNDSFALRDGLITPRHDNVFSTPEALLDFLHLVADTPEVKGISADCVGQIRNARRGFRPDFYVQRPACREKFMQLMRHPHFFDYAWDIMHEYQILQCYLPEWDMISGLMQFDLFHAYTVDEHTHRVVKNINDYFRQKSEFPRCHRIVQDLDKPEILYLAGIFHDIAKGRNGDHSVLGEDDVRSFCLQHDMSNSDAQLIAWLVRHHLLMSVVAQRRDIYDADVILEFASTVKSHQHLNLLYALTLADIRATNDSLWNEWKGSLLRELYLLTQKALDNGLQCQDTVGERVAENKRKALALLADTPCSECSTTELWSHFDSNYFNRFKPPQIAWHTQSIVKAIAHEKSDLLISASDETAIGGTEFLVYGRDRPALFAQIASVMDSRNCSIHDAYIAMTDDGFIFDSLLVLEQDGSRLSERRIKELTQAITEQLEKPGRQHENTRRISRQLRQLKVPVKVRFFDINNEATLVELEALDAPGLLAKIGHAFVDCMMTLRLAKISTIGERAEDVFIVTNAMGTALTPQEQVKLKQHILVKLDQLEDISIK